MIPMRIWPTRYCPTCGGKVVRTRALPDGKGGWVGGAGEFPVWVGLILGWFAASVAGKVVGVYVGMIVGVLGFALLVWYAVHVERTNFAYSCEACGRTLRWGNWRRSNASRNEG
jgi:endogenous inhibitor of DNA gyrase (YacG/DUF329 family)